MSATISCGSRILRKEACFMSFMWSRIYSRLFSAYEEIVKNNPGPDCAVHKKYDQQQLVRPAIPFVGHKFAEQTPRILVYASAENLANYYPGSEAERPWMDHDEVAMTRHLVRFEESKTDPNFFPDVHIQPMYDGTLATAVLYIASQYMDITGLTPRDFYERIAIANCSKYTKETERQRNIRLYGINEGSDKNTDPTQMPAKEARAFIQASYPFLEADIKTLCPDIVILPQKLYEMNRQFWENAGGKKKPQMIGIYQLGPIPINCTISKNEKYRKNENTLHPTVRHWLDNIRRVSKNNYLYVFGYLDHRFAEIRLGL